jgi:Arc/MetJ-type ribon-helix-helix transcriptional regulator
VSTINFNLPDALNTYLTEQAARRGYANASEFVQNLIENDRHRQVKTEIETMLMESIDGPFSEWSTQDGQDIRDTGRRLIERRRAR